MCDLDTNVGLAEQLINMEVIHFWIGSPNENKPLFIVRPKFHRGPYMDLLFYGVGLQGIQIVSAIVCSLYNKHTT